MRAGKLSLPGSVAASLELASETRLERLAAGVDDGQRHTEPGGQQVETFPEARR